MKNHNILSSLTKGEIEDPFQSRGLHGKIETSQVASSLSKNNFRILRSIQRSPLTICSSDRRGGIVVIHRQEENLIKKIDFKQSNLLDSLENYSS